MYDIKPTDNFVLKFEQTVRDCWDKPALNNYKGPVLTYGELAREIEKLNLVWKAAGLKRGDKIAINAKSSAEWAKLFFAAQAGGFVAVQIFNAFTPDDTFEEPEEPQRSAFPWKYAAMAAVVAAVGAAGVLLWKKRGKAQEGEPLENWDWSNSEEE